VKTDPCDLLDAVARCRAIGERRLVRAVRAGVRRGANARIELRNADSVSAVTVVIDCRDRHGHVWKRRMVITFDPLRVVAGKVDLAAVTRGVRLACARIGAGPWPTATVGARHRALSSGALAPGARL
jgi:hypothetical protein